jgi:uncharacterized membrane protein YfcA
LPDFDLSLINLTFLLAATFFAGFIDAVVGGGGLINIPALFSAFPQAVPAYLFATNKVASISGTSWAALRYARKVRIEWSAVLPAALAAFVFSFIGAWAIAHVPGDWLRRALPFVLVALVIYTYAKKDLGTDHAPNYRGRTELLLAILAGSLIGFYDGFFGPGTGSFLVFMFVRLFGYSFLSASAASKVVNVTCNLAALTYFIPAGYVWWHVGLAMAAFNIAGSQVGSHMAIARGSGFVRHLFLVVVSVLIVKTFYDGFVR